LRDAGIDQAQGLRRMFRPGAARVIEVLAATPGIGRTTVASNLAVALSQAGSETLLFDAAAPLGGASGVAPRPDCVVLEAGSHAACWQASSAAQGLLVVSRVAASITGAYGLIKRMCRDPHALQLHVLVNRAEGEAEAAQIFANLAQVTRDYLGARLFACGAIPADGALTRASAAGQSVLHTDPDAPASRAFRRLAERLLRCAPAHAQLPRQAASADRFDEGRAPSAASTAIPF
jgi:MinD-like ATPase involved in chromosome partitioning or flagellar assembly